MLKKYKNIKVGEFFEDGEYHYVKTEYLNENSQFEYPAIELESGVTVYFSDEDDNYYSVDCME